MWRCCLVFTACWSRSSNCYSQECQVWPTVRKPLTVCQPGRRESNWEQGRDFSSLTRLPASLIHWAPWLYNGPVQCTTNVQNCSALSSLYVLIEGIEALIYIIQFSWTNIGSLAWVSFGFSFHKTSVVERGNVKIRKNTYTPHNACVKII